MSEEAQPELLRKLADKEEKRALKAGVARISKANFDDAMSDIRTLNKEIGEIWAQLHLARRRVRKSKLTCSQCGCPIDACSCVAAPIVPELIADIASMAEPQRDGEHTLTSASEKVSKTVKLRKETSNSDKHKGLDQLKEEAAGQATCPEERGG